MSHEEIVLRHFTKFKFISSMTAFEMYGITRLSATIYNLRQQGIKIEAIWRTTTNRYGNQVRYVDYYLARRKGLWKRKSKQQQ